MAKKQSGITFSIDDRELKRIYDGLKSHEEVAKKAVVAALNRTVQTTNSKMQSYIIKTYNIKKADLNGGNQYKGESSNNLIKVKKANYGKLNASVEIRGGYLTLYRFAQGDKQPTNKKGARVKVKVSKGKARKMSNVNFINYPRGNKNNLQIFQRHRDSRDISRVLKTISVAHMAGNEKVAEPTQKIANETLQKRATHELERGLQKIKG